MDSGGFDIGLGRVITMVGERFGRWAETALLLVVVLGISAVCIYAFATLIVQPTIAFLGGMKITDGGLAIFRISIDNIDIWITVLFYVVIILLVIIFIIIFRTRRRINRKILNDLARLLEEGNSNLLNRQINNDQEFKDWKNDMDQWVSTIMDLLKRKVSESEYLLFKNLVSVIPISFPHAYNQLHNRELTFLDWRLGRLRSVIDRYSV